MKMVKPSSPVQKAFLFPFIVGFVTLIIFLTMCHIKDYSYISCLRDSGVRVLWQAKLDSGNNRETLGNKKETVPFAVGEAGEECDVFKGKWVYDNARPFFEEQDCPYVERQITCQAHGRPDKEYQRWRWQPHGCSLPSFNATLLLERLRGKKLMFVGDSMNRNQFVSMICLLNKVIPDKNAKSLKVRWSKPTIFKAKDYNATVEFYWAPYLLRSNADPNLDLGTTPRLFQNGTIDVHGEYWKTADIIVFNSYLWWKSRVKLLLRGSFDDEVKDVIIPPTPDMYRIAISSLTGWINKNINPKEKRVFFNSMSPIHSSSNDWGGKPNGSCFQETTMTENISLLGSDESLTQVVDEEFRKLEVPVTYLNITHLSSYRIDGHTSVYNFKWTPLTSEQRSDPTKAADCIHWCVPGVPDTWNEILFWKIFYP